MTPASKLQTVFLRGIVTKWKTPVYFGLDEPMSLETVNIIVKAVEVAGFRVRSVSFDLGNKVFLKDVAYTKEHSYFIPNPTDSLRKTYLLPDPPHLLKTLRNHLFQKGKLS